MVGTATNAVTFSRATRRLMIAGSNSGIKLAHSESPWLLERMAESRALLVKPRWDNTAPLGKPVVPEVY